MRAKTLTDLLHRAATRPDCGIRLIDRRERASWHSWSDLLAGATRTAGALQRLGVAPGNRIGLILPSSAEFFHAFFGVLLARAVPVPLYPPVRLGRLDEYHRGTARMLNSVNARLIVTAPRVRRLLGDTVLAARPPLGCATPAELDDDGWQPRQADEDDLALVQFSSGTTRDPQPVALTHRALVRHAEALNAFWPDTAEQLHSGVSWLPLYHDMGLIGCVFTALERPAVLNLIPPEVFVARPAVWLRTISRYGATISPAPNFAYALCVDRIAEAELAGVDLSSWRVALNGAETVVPSVIRAFADRFRRWGFDERALTPVYGMSEAALAVTFSDVSRAPRSIRIDRDVLAGRGVAREHPRGLELVSLGRPLPGCSIRIVDGEHKTLGERQVGSIEVSSPSLMRGYLGQPAATGRVLRDGWLDTGDLGFLLDGELYLTGRAKDMLLVRGRNYAPEPVELAAAAAPGARKGCVVAASHLPDGAGTEQIVVFVEAARRTPRSEYPSLAERCREVIVGRTGLLADRVVPLAPGTLPRTSSGKLRRRETLERWIDGTLTPPEPVNLLRVSSRAAGSALSFARLRWRELVDRAD
jgi:fatty-acyl-CoA synthase